MIILTVFMISSVIVPAEGEYETIFTINLLTPNTSRTQMICAMRFENTLEELGIAVGVHEMTDWGNMASRWGMKVPTYEEGGYDVMFWGFSSELDWDNYDMFDSRGGGNYYQFENPAFDNLIDQYSSEPNATLRKNILGHMQTILWGSLPAIGIVNHQNIYAKRENVTGIDFELVNKIAHRTEKWQDLTDGSIILGVPFDLRNEYNVFRGDFIISKFWMQSVYAGLFEREQDIHGWQPVIAHNYTISPDKRSITVNLDLDAKFSDGNPVLAEDVEYTYMLHQTVEVGSGLYGAITNTIETIVVDDSDTLTFTFFEPTAFAFDLLTLGIIDKSEVEPLISSYGYTIFDEELFSGNVGDSLVKSCGPFVLDEYNETTEEVKMSRNEYWMNLTVSGGNNALLDEYVIKYVSDADTALSMIESGQIDIVHSEFYMALSKLDSLDGVEPVFAAETAHQEMAVNMKHPILGTGELTPVGTPSAATFIRKAFAHIFDREFIANNLTEGYGSPCYIPVPEPCYGFNDALPPYEYNLTIARTYIEAAGYDLVELTTPTPTTPTTTASYVTVTISLISILGVGLVSLIRKKKIELEILF